MSGQRSGGSGGSRSGGSRSSGAKPSSTAKRREPWPWQVRAEQERAKKEAKARRKSSKGKSQKGGSSTGRSFTGRSARTREAREPGKWSLGWRLWVKRSAIVIGGCFALGLLLFAFAYARTDIPNPNRGFQSQTSYVYYADGKTELGRFSDQNRTSIPLGQVPQPVQDAVIAAEDHTFWTNKGIDPKGIIRAAFNNASGGPTQGASTITQQYVKVFYLSQERSWSRKMKEAILSLKIQRQMSKEQILQGYLNTIYFGRGAYGIEAAAQAYFNKPAHLLTAQEGAALAAMINSPNNYDPANGPAERRALHERYVYVIDSMDSLGTLPAHLVGARNEYRLPTFPKIQGQSQYGGQRGHILRMVRAELNKLGFSDREIDGGGLRITTTFTKKDMDAAAAGVAQERPDLPGLHAAVASVDPKTGALRGMYAGQDYLKSQINWAVEGGAPGSAFKPFSLATGLTYGYSLKSVFDGSSPQTIEGTEFKNEGEGGGVSYGNISLTTATEDSVNTAYLNLVDSMPNGVAEVHQTAIDMGIPQNAPGFDANLSMVLGSMTVSPIDMANAYGTIADGGLEKPVYFVESVKTKHGDVRFKHHLNTNQAISRDVAADTSYALQQVTVSGTGTNANVIGREVAGKTGTATDDLGHVRSSWFVGYTPQLVTAVMYSRGNGNEPLDGYLDTYFGGEHPARTWAAVMGRALSGEPVLDFPDAAFLDQTVEGHEPTPTYTPTPTPTKSGSPKPSNNPKPKPNHNPKPKPKPKPKPSKPPNPGPEPSESPSPLIP